MTFDANLLIHDVRTMIDNWTIPGLRCVLLWGSILDVINGSTTFDERRDVDVLVVCDNVEKNQDFGIGMHGQRAINTVNLGQTYDVTVVDFGYVVEALQQGRWTVIRAVRDAVPILDTGSLAELKMHLPNISPFVNSHWADWVHQAESLTAKAAILIADGNYGYARILLRDSMSTLAHAILTKLEGQPPTPSNFAALLVKHQTSTPLLREYLQFHEVTDSRRDQAQGEWLHMTEVLRGVQL